MGAGTGGRNRWSEPLSSLDEVEVRDQVILRCLKDAFEALKASIPPEEIAKAVRPYFTHCGMAISLNGSRRFNISGKDIKELALPYFWTSNAFSDGECSPLFIYEEGAVVEVYDCSLRNIGPWFCLPLSHDVTEGICRNLNPAYQYMFTHQLYDGDDHCRYVLRPKCSKKVLDDLGALKEEVSLLDMSEEERDSLRGEMIGELLIILDKVLVDVCGTEGALVKLLPMANATGHALAGEMGTLLKEQGDARAEEACLILRSCMKQMGGWTSGDGTAMGRTASCPFKDGNIVLCKQYESLLTGVVQTLDPKLEFAYARMMTEGDSECAWTLSKREAGPKDRVRGTGAEDPLLTLKMRFARGEISEGEYLRSKDILSGK